MSYSDKQKLQNEKVGEADSTKQNIYYYITKQKF